MVWKSFTSLQIDYNFAEVRAAREETFPETSAPSGPLILKANPVFFSVSHLFKFGANLTRVCLILCTFFPSFRRVRRSGRDARRGRGRSGARSGHHLRGAAPQGRGKPDEVSGQAGEAGDARWRQEEQARICECHPLYDYMKLACNIVRHARVTLILRDRLW